MKQIVKATALKAVMVGVVLGGIVTACQNGDSPVGSLIQQDAATSTVTQVKNGATTQSDEERKAEQAHKIAEFLAKPEVKEMSAGLEEIAQAVAVAVEDKALTQRIYEKCLEKFDGETNTLWMHLEADGKLKTNGGGWNKRIDAELGKGRKNAVVKGIGNVDAAIKKFEKTVGAPLHLFWMYPSEWNKKTTPLVAFVPMNEDRKSLKTIPAFDSKGNTFALDVQGRLAKERPIIVITINERTAPDGNIRANMLVVASEKDLLSVKQRFGTSQNNTLKLKILTPKSIEDRIQSGFAVTKVMLSAISIPKVFAKSKDDDSEIFGSMEFFYTFICNNFLDNSNQWLGKAASNEADAAVFYNKNSYINSGIPNQYKISLPSHPQNGGATTFKYYEADFPLFDDLLEIQNIQFVSMWDYNSTYVDNIWNLNAAYIFVP